MRWGGKVKCTLTQTQCQTSKWKRQHRNSIEYKHKHDDDDDSNNKTEIANVFSPDDSTISHIPDLLWNTVHFSQCHFCSITFAHARSPTKHPHIDFNANTQNAQPLIRLATTSFYLATSIPISRFCSTLYTLRLPCAFTSIQFVCLINVKHFQNNGYNEYKYNEWSRKCGVSVSVTA